LSKITLEQYIDSMGSAPPGNELERCNCPHEGSKGHKYCGWCSTHSRPRAMCGCVASGKDTGADSPHDFAGLTIGSMVIKPASFLPPCRWSRGKGKVVWCHNQNKKYYNGPCSKRCMEAEE